MYRQLFILLIIHVTVNLASKGDRSNFFNFCIDKCFSRNCSRQFTAKNEPTLYEKTQPFYLKLLGWDCESECKYICMWKAINDFKVYYNEDAPQFYGKWPFVRILGIQEPASTISSILNFVANYIMMKKMIKKMPRYAPFKMLWIAFGYICLNAWFWSALFHTRDTAFTERMDYFSAFLLVLSQFNSFIIRFLKLRKNLKWLMYLINIGSLLYFMYHCNYLSSIKFDYGYNMQANIFVGILNSICWLSWCAYKRYVKKNKYVWRCALSVILFDVLIVFEVFDFRPIWWFLDSHALWHFSTIFLPYYWYNFLVDDNYYLRDKMNKFF